MDDGKIVAIIPARGGSKRVPNKNLRLIAGMSLVQRAINGAVEVGLFDDIVVLTDSSKIAAEAEAAGARIPYLRKGDAADKSQIEEVIQNFIKFENLPENTIIVLLQPTSPLRTESHIHRALELYAAADCECLVTVKKLNHKAYPSLLMYEQLNRDRFFNPFSKPEKQKVDLFVRDGPMILINLAKNWLAGKKFVWPSVGLVTCDLCSIDIDTPADLLVAKLLAESEEYYCECDI